MSSPIDREMSLAELEGQKWPDPPPDSTYLVKSIHALRSRPIGSLTVEEMRRLIGQDVGLPWLLPMAVEILRNTAHAEEIGGFYDDDLLSAVLTRSRETWLTMPDLAQEVKDVLAILKDVSLYIEPEIEQFMSVFPESS
ncbi:contact-dependent growth inhibition system immunity protein [Streptomyces atratus]|uniref:Uncharacterized protein n=1 Tax=Streptomyces atratus TaxID=1893 RepID=A0A1K2D3A4_STRAR|nr:contact-dependent growth inhibition system immunity protein [Streptomyces atratus]SFY17705.1 hypothetical protein SAMN02787144_1012139 [Streptomyces atratus]